MGTKSNGFAHVMSYTLHPHYLEGQGYGSSYIIELYKDFGYIGLMLYSVILGAFLSGICYLYKKNKVVCYCCLVILMSVYFAPRDAALNALLSLLKLPSLAVCVSIVTISYLVYKIKLWRIHENK